MKKMIALAVMALFMVSALPAFGGEAKQESNLVTIVKDTIKPGEVREKNKVKNPLPKVNIFQSMADGIKDGSRKARGESLRTGNTK